MATVVFTSTESYLEVEPLAAERAEVEVTEYIEGTYGDLRTGPEGDEIAHYETGTRYAGWTITVAGHPASGRRFSDWAVAV